MIIRLFKGVIQLFSTTSTFHFTPYALRCFFTPTPKSAFGINTTSLLSTPYNATPFCCFIHSLYYIQILYYIDNRQSIYPINIPNQYIKPI